MGIIAWIVLGAIAGFITNMIMGGSESVIATIILGRHDLSRSRRYHLRWWPASRSPRANGALFTAGSTERVVGLGAAET